MRERLLRPLGQCSKLHKLLVLFTLLLALPLSAWGTTEEVTKTITFNKTVSTVSSSINNSTMSVSVNEQITGGASTSYDGMVKILDAYSLLDSYSCSTGGGAVFNVKSTATNDKIFTIEIPGNYPKVPTQVTLTVSYNNSVTGTNGENAKIQVGDYGNGDKASTPPEGTDPVPFYHYYHPYRSNEASMSETTLTYTASNTSGLGTNRDNPGSLCIFVYLNGNNNPQTTFTIKEATITYNREDYGLTIGNTVVKSDNRTDILGDGKVSYVHDATNNSGTLTLNGASITSTSTPAIESSLGSLTVKLAGTNTINCGSNNAFNLAANSGLIFEADGTSPGQLTITSTSSITTESFYSPSTATVTYTGLVASNPNSTSVLISPPTSYDITIAGVAVTNANASAITGTGITGTVSYDATTNTLTLNGATIDGSGGITYGGNSLLTIALNGSNSVSTTNASETVAFYLNGGTINFVKATGANSASLTATCGSGGKPIETSVSSLGSGLYWKPIERETMVITEDPDFVIVGDYVISGTVNGENGTIVYDASSKTLTLNGYQKSFDVDGQHAIQTGVEGLKVKLVGENSIICESSDTYVFKAFQDNASIQFIRNDANSKLTMTMVSSTANPFGSFGDGKITYDGLFYYSSGDTEKLITQPAAPEISKATIYDATAQHEYTFAKIDYETNDKDDGDVKYASANPKLMYSFDYADTNLTDVTNAEYPGGNGIKMLSPGVLTAWVEVGSVKSPVSTGVRFGIIENPIEVEFDGTQKAVDFTPAPSMTGSVSVNITDGSFNFATIDATNKKLTITKCFKGRIPANFTYTGTETYTSLNDSTILTFNITPSKPTLSLESGAYYKDLQQVEATTTVTGATVSLTIGGQAVANPYTFSTLGLFTASAKTSLNSVDSDPVEGTYVINNQPVISAKYSDNSDYDGTKNGNVTYSIHIAQLQANCKVWYYYGTDKGSAQEYNNTVDTVLVDSKTVNAFVRYTDPTDNSIVYDTQPVTVSYTVKQDLGISFAAGQNYQTCCLGGYSLNKPQGIKVSIITGVSGNSVTTTAIDYIPDGVAVLLEKDGDTPVGGYVAETYTGAAGNFSSNLLKKAQNETNADNQNYYVLYNNEFVKAFGLIMSGHNYLDLNSVNPSRGMYSIGDGSTGIHTVNSEEGIVNSEVWFDMQGRRIDKPTRPGLYIKNGKKVVVNNK